MLVDAMQKYGGLTDDDIASKLTTFGAQHFTRYENRDDSLVKGSKCHLPHWGALHEPSHQLGIANSFQDGHYGQD